MLQKLAAEFTGTAMLLIAVVGSGIMGDTLAGGNTAIALLANAVATGCMLYVIISTLGPISGAHFNPAVTLFFALQQQFPKAQILPYISVQIAGGILGVWLTHVMFDLSILQLSTTTHRTGYAQWSSEILATLGLLFVITGCKPATAPALVSIYITGAYWFTASTSFANPAVTIARSFTDTFAGIQPTHAPAFVAMQLFAMALATLTLPRLFAKP
ncbi:Aquaporin Z [Pelagimonas phthalicica]|uniref:Aquaporin Z n=1 Tax=Pelagimonas phthalicica TaxID=1037362 RepID=A0A238JCF2_9RHOB|nr:MIP/aquaporin family protein [Pelagimonas phthalicica]TDS91322.1 glycerol uptake facilitator-like aquaporin [Pelagimonas phthalicica]SMX28370.1 Aquaporin Z [Pelagimonas phthalicica]